MNYPKSNFLRLLQLVNKKVNSNSEILSQTIQSLLNDRNLVSDCFISFEFEDSTYYLTISGFKYELSMWRRNEEESDQLFLFKYEEGYQEEIGELRQFEESFKNALNECNADDISISDEE